MGHSGVNRVLIVAREAADSPRLAAVVRRRAAAERCAFTLLIPARPHGLRALGYPERPGRTETERRLSEALPSLSEAAGEPLPGIVGAHDPVIAVRDALELLGFDEVILFTPRSSASPERGPDNLCERIRRLGVQVTEVAQDGTWANPAPAA